MLSLSGTTVAFRAASVAGWSRPSCACTAFRFERACSSVMPGRFSDRRPRIPTINRRLRQQAFRQERSIASLVREMVARGLDGETSREKPARADQFSSVRAGRSTQGRLSPVSERHDETLTAAFEK